MLPYSIIAGGSYVSDGESVELQINSQNPPDKFIVRNVSDWGDDTAISAIEAWWVKGMANGSYKSIDQAITTGALSSNAGTTDGFTYIDTSNPPTFTPLAATAITAANPAVISMASVANLHVGDVIRVYNVTGMQQIAGYDFTITAITPGSPNLVAIGYLDASGFAAPATAAQVLKIIPSRFYPRWRYITKITQAVNAVVTFSVAHDFVIGEIISFRVSSSFGMDQMNNLQGRVLSVTASTVTVDIDSTGFTAFAFPTSAQALAGVSPAVAVPSASGPVPGAVNPHTTLEDAFDNRNVRVMQLGSAVVGPAAATMEWMAIKYDQYNGN